ncbi:MAG TPA: type II toxin-antitoxin system VapC family toxin [Thermoanaerobaculia bacterium]|jgi:predicted nucleic-acid-binding protein|nr:type II toxin-antitoxin system VapC family toxin [Thermoanaerobaculia bacterium]
MIAVDTNIIVRLIVDDDPEQGARVRRLLEAAAEAGESCLVSDPVLCELAWVLSSQYRAGRAEIVAAVQSLLARALFIFEDRTALLQAFEAYQGGRADFSDYLIGAKAQAHGARTTWIFDRGLRNQPGFSMLG